MLASWVRLALQGLMLIRSASTSAFSWALHLRPNSFLPWPDGSAGDRVLALARGRRAVARGTRPFGALALVKKGLASLGLGLAIVRDLVEVYGGELQWQTPAQGRGLGVSLTLPAALTSQMGD